MVSKNCSDLTFDIWSWAVKKNIWLSTLHVPGVKNNIADPKSWFFGDTKEWPLNPYMFEQVCEKFGKPEDFFQHGWTQNVTVKFHLSHTQMRSQQMPLLGIGTTFKVMSFLHLIGRVLVKIKWDKASIIDIVPCCFLAVVVAISKDGGTQHSKCYWKCTADCYNYQETSIMDKTTTHSSMFIRCVQMMSSWHYGD